MEEKIEKDEERDKMRSILEDAYDKLGVVVKAADALCETIRTTPPVDGTLNGISLICEETRSQIADVFERMGRD
jgi:hypothetical protein